MKQIQEYITFVKTYYHPHAAMLTGTTLVGIWSICNVLSFFHNPLSCRLLVMIAGLFLYVLLYRKGDPFFLNLYKLPFMRNMVLYGRSVEISLYRSLSLSMVFSFFLVSLVVLCQIEYADPAILQGFKIPVLPYLFLRAAIAFEGGNINSVYMEKIPYFYETHLLIISEWGKSGQLLIVYCVSFLLLALGDLGNREGSRIKALKNSFLDGLHKKYNCNFPSLEKADACNLCCKHEEVKKLRADLFDKIADLSAQAEEACSRATSEGSFTLGCKAAASILGLCCSPLSCFSAEISLLGD